MEQIGLFGGTFNPIHIGHLQAAVEVKENFNLNRVILIPSAHPPHKRNKNIADALDRLNMVQMSLIPNTGLEVSDVELYRNGPSYTIDTITQIKKKFSHAVNFFLIMGIDAFLEIDTWRQFQSIFEKIDIIILTRPWHMKSTGSTKHDIVSDYLKANVPGEYIFNKFQDAFEQKGKKHIYLSDISQLAISSTHIRNRITRERSIHYLVMPAVEQYIKKKRLYQ